MLLCSLLVWRHGSAPSVPPWQKVFHMWKTFPQFHMWKTFMQFSQKFLICGNVEMWKCGNVEMWKCGNVEMWKCGNEENIKI